MYTNIESNSLYKLCYFLKESLNLIVNFIKGKLERGLYKLCYFVVKFLKGKVI
jgi:hypothetical protein